MSSATSTSDVQLKAEAASRSQPEQASTFRAAHFFVLASLMAATGAVVMSRQSTPEHLVLISLTIGTAGLAAAGFYRMLSPLVGDASAHTSESLSDRARSVFEREKALTLRSLKELEFDRSMGKVSQADFEEMAARLRSRALTLMKQLDEDGTGYRTVIERELRSRLAERSADRKPSATASAAVPAAAPAVAHATCACGTENDPDAVFCKRCGNRLSAGA